MQAAMVYLRMLRDAHGLSQAEVARAVGVESKQVYRWERGESEPLASGLFAFVHAVQGRIEDVERLLLGNANEDLGRQLAEAILKEAPPEERELRRRRAIALIDDLLADPKKLDQLLGYGDRLREGNYSVTDPRTNPISPITRMASS